MRACKCPGCGAELNIDDNNRDFAFCQYCGAKIMLDDYRSTQRIVDEARLKEAEIKMRQLEMEERKQAQAIEEREKARRQEQERELSEKNEKKRFRLISVITFLASLFFIVIGVVLCAGSDTDNSIIAGFFLLSIGIIIMAVLFLILKWRNDAENARNGMVKLTFSGNQDENYQVVQSNYAKMGFKNIMAVNLQDLFLGVLDKPGKVESITIDGLSPIYGKWYSPDAQVIIKYHGFANKKG
jgi:hypothetical protein